MGRYTIEISQEAQKHLQEIHKFGNQSMVRKIEQFFFELSEHPYTGTGKPEQMKYIPGVWSRRLNKKDRIRYTVSEELVTVYLLSALGHYNDK
ncbi:MAG: Txe/YoeB family addiction module toxin [Prevotellaceae bacterium]|jgi:toxin YoeB|nr:Txe/YoeB family addiction module toxin [Prevotellaceae bacterium]